MTPTSPTTAFPIGERTEDPLAMYLADVGTIPCNLGGRPRHLGAGGPRRARACPSASRCWPHPLGEAVLLRAARAVEALTGFAARPALATSEVR